MSGKYPSELRTECSRHGRQLTKRASLAREAEKVGPNRGRACRWALTKVAARPGEGEKVDHLSRWRAVLGACDARCARLERDAYPEYWPFRGVRTHRSQPKGRENS